MSCTAPHPPVTRDNIQLTIADGLTSPTLSLSTRIRRRHLQAGVLRVRCQAVIYSVWSQTTMAVFPGPGNNNNNNNNIEVCVVKRLFIITPQLSGITRNILVQNHFFYLIIKFSICRSFFPPNFVSLTHIVKYS